MFFGHVADTPFCVRDSHPSVPETSCVSDTVVVTVADTAPVSITVADTVTFVVTVADTDADTQQLSQ